MAPGSDAEVAVRRRDAQLFEEGLGHLAIVVLAGMDQDLAGVPADGAAERRRLHELWARPHHGEDQRPRASRQLTPSSDA